MNFTPLGRIAAALERIAIALESASGLDRPKLRPTEESTILYHDDLADVVREMERAKYHERGGKQLRWDEPIPEPPAKKKDNPPDVEST